MGRSPAPSQRPFRLAELLLVGVALNAFFGWWWADPLAALAMIWWVRGETKGALEAARTGRRDQD